MTPIDTILDALRAGQKHYGESGVTQLEHAIQCAMQAEREGASSALVAASLLHDLGHLVNPEDRAQTARGEDCAHELIAADYLQRWFGDAVTLPIRLHVAAKRYLTATEPDYAATLSAGSALSLELQGGPFSTDEARRFAALPGAPEAIRLRRWDERAKEHDLAIPPVDHFRACLEENLASNKS
jgi:phosphonate degradation associated HDIG domain protein